MNKSNYYTFKASNGTTVTVLRGDVAPKMTAGGGGWSVEARPKRVALRQSGTTIIVSARTR
jgi:hypothetical protein